MYIFQRETNYEQYDAASNRTRLRNDAYIYSLRNYADSIKIHLPPF